MIITFKVLPESEKDQWVGWFGENLLKVRIQESKAKALEGLLSFIERDLGIKSESLKLLNRDEKNFFTFEMPDVAWELFLTAIE